MRRFVIGDIHGCSKALRSLLEIVSPEPTDQIIFLGDYVDRGPDSRGVVDLILGLRQRCNVVTLLGNHEIMLRDCVRKGFDSKLWLASGGGSTIASYGGALNKIPERHLEFFDSLLPYYECEDSIFVHANYEYPLLMDQQNEETMFWTHLGLRLPPPHCSGKRVFVGHTPQGGGNILDAGYLVCVDTYCFGIGYLTAMNVDNDEVFQVDKHGHSRRDTKNNLVAAWNWIRALFRKKSEDEDQSTISSDLKDDAETNSQNCDATSESAAKDSGN